MLLMLKKKTKNAQRNQSDPQVTYMPATLEQAQWLTSEIVVLWDYRRETL